jgi:nitroreductase
MRHVLRADLEHLALLASRAPSVHNTQPWEFVTLDDGLQLRADWTRQLTVLDPDGRLLTMSCGAALHHLEVAAEAMGFEVATTLLPDEDDPDLLAEARLHRKAEVDPEDVARAVDVLHRHTYRGRFTDEPLPEGLLDRLREAVEGEGAMLRTLREGELLTASVLLEHAEQDLLATPGYAEELAAWVWPAGTRPGAREGRRTDGMPELAVEHGADRAENLPGRHFLAEPATPVDVTPMAERPTLVLLTTVGDSTYDWVAAGRALSALLLQATHEGVAAQPLGQALDVPASRAELRRELGVVGVPQMLLRLGRAESHPQTPRRPVSEVLHPHPRA